MGSASEVPPDGLLGGKIRLLKRIGRGGMGDVWIARNEATHAEVAVKTLQKSERTSAHDERFRREARLAATISHRNVVRIFDLLDDDDGTLGLVMELLRGGTLESCMRERGPMSTMHSIAVAVPILSALHHVHQKGIVHRDVKPANIFFAVEPDDHVIPKVLDFGIAKLPAASTPLTVDGSVLGTPHYMAPEQIRGQEDLDGRSDMFSLAVVLYEMLTGLRVFQRESAVASLAAVLEYEVDPDPRIEPRVWVAMSRALAKRPYERFATCGEFAEALRRAVDASDDDFARSLQELRPRSDAIPSASPTPYATRPRPKPVPPRKLGWTLAAAGVAILAVAATLVVTRSGSTQARADQGRQTSGASIDPTTAPGQASNSRAQGSGVTQKAPGQGPEAEDPAAPALPAQGMKPVLKLAPATAGSSRVPAPPHSGAPRPPNVVRPPTKPVATSPGF